MVSLSSVIERESTSMDHFVSILDLVPFISEKSAGIQFLFG